MNAENYAVDIETLCKLQKKKKERNSVIHPNMNEPKEPHSK